MDSRFSDGNLYDNIDKFATALGYKNAGIIITLAMVPWKDSNDRNSFIEAITGQPMQGNDTTGGV